MHGLLHIPTGTILAISSYDRLEQYKYYLTYYTASDLPFSSDFLWWRHWNVQKYFDGDTFILDSVCTEELEVIDLGLHYVE